MKMRQWLVTGFIFIAYSSFALGSLTTATSTLPTKSDMLAVPVKDIQRFAAVIAEIKRYYIEPVEDKVLFDNAIRGMLTSLDPHSDYLDADSLRDLQSVTSGEFSGIGVEIMPEGGFIKVISPLDGSPAEKAGIKAGDLIVRVENRLVKDMTVREVLNAIRGPTGSKVNLTVIRKGDKKPLKFEVTRNVVKIETTKSKLLEKGYGYVRIAFFQGPAKDQLVKAVAQLQKDSGGQLDGLVLDLRNNPGGLLDSAIEVADQFLDATELKENKLIVYTKGRIPGSDMKAKATPGDILKGVPVVVLINEGSASASEIVAGALQDHNRAIILGTKSFGKGSVQTVIPIDDENGIKLTTALYYTPSGRSIQADGIRPDVMVADLKIPHTEGDTIVFDPILEQDLAGHLENNKKQGAKDTTIKADAKIEEGLAHKDFQLYQSLMLLKGLHATRGVQ